MNNNIIIDYVYLDSDERRQFMAYEYGEYYPKNNKKCESDMIVINVQPKKLEYHCIDIITHNDFIIINPNTYKLIL